MTLTEKKQLEEINAFLIEIAYNTSENLDSKFSTSVPYSMQLDYIGIGKSYNGLKLLDNSLYNFEGSYYTSNGLGNVSQTVEKTVFATDLKERIITEKDFYKVGNFLWYVNEEPKDEHYLSDWFLDKNCDFNKTGMDAFCKLIHNFVKDRKSIMTNLYHPESIIFRNFGNICYYALLKISNNTKEFQNNEYSFYFLKCATHL